MAKFLFFLFLVFVVLFLIFGWKEKAQFIKSTKTYKQTSCQVKSGYQNAEKWARKQYCNMSSN